MSHASFALHDVTNITVEKPRTVYGTHRIFQTQYVRITTKDGIAMTVELFLNDDYAGLVDENAEAADFLGARA